MRRTNVGYFLACLILILSLVLGTGCGFLPDIDISPPTTSPTSTTTPIPINPDWTLPPAQGQSVVLPSIADVVAKVKPSVVAITTEVVTIGFFNQPFTQEGAGSGWIVDENGIIVTNNHVVDGAESITVTLDDGRTFPVDVDKVATDPLTDLAVLRIAAENLSAADRGDSSQLRVGDWVVAIGNALGQGISAKEGIVSRIGVPVLVSSGQTLYDLIETSAAINPGNSGGPLVNMAGEVIGITSAKLAAIEVEGIGYAISTKTADPVIEGLVKTGYVIRPWLGVAFYTVDEGVASRYGLAVNQGALVTELAPGSPADGAGIERGDVITRFGDTEITSHQDLLQAIHSSQIGRGVEITYWRGNTAKTTTTTLLESPPP